MRGIVLAAALLPFALAGCLADPAGSRDVALDRSRIAVQGLAAETVTYDGRTALKLSPADPTVDATGIAVLRGPDFASGTIELDLAGRPCEGIGPGARGFIGIAFRLQGDAPRYECFYLRLTNARCDDQFRRNHSAQYISHPDFPWERLRQESPGAYESYVDLVVGAWTKVRIEVAGTKAKLFVGGSDQPCLIVNDLKLGDTHGAIALWDGPFTIGWFSNLRVKPA